MERWLDPVFDSPLKGMLVVGFDALVSFCDDVDRSSTRRMFVGSGV